MVFGNTITIRDAASAIGVHLAADGEPLVFNNVIDPGTEAIDDNYGIAFGDGSRAMIFNNTVRFGVATLVGSWWAADSSADVVVDNNIVWSNGAGGARYCIYLSAADHVPSSLASNILFDCPDGLIHEYDGAVQFTADKVNELDFARDNLVFDLTDGLHSYFENEETDWRLRDGGTTDFEALKGAGVDAWAVFGGEVKDFDGVTRSGDGEHGWTPGAFENDQ